MADQRENILKAELEEITHCVNYWEDKWDEKYNELRKLVGVCPLCQNHHYPHCKPINMSDDN